MDITFLNDYVVLVVVGICLCIGYVLKNSFPKLDNKYIPLITSTLGVVLNVWISKEAMEEKLSVLYTADQLTKEEYLELMNMLEA